MDPLWLIVILLLVFWGGGLAYGATSLVHVLLVVALVIVVYRLATGQRI